MDRIGSLDAITIDCADPLLPARFRTLIFGTDVDGAEGDGSHDVDWRVVAHPEGNEFCVVHRHEEEP